MPLNNVSSFCANPENFANIPTAPARQPHDGRLIVHVGFHSSDKDFFCASYSPDTGIFTCWEQYGREGRERTVAADYIARDSENYKLDFTGPTPIQKLASTAMNGTDLRMDITATCPGCSESEGRVHQIGCEMEICPFCGGKLFGCACRFRLLSLVDPSTYDATTGFLPPEVFADGLNDEMQARWNQILADRGRCVFIKYPPLCSYCGTPRNLMSPLPVEWGAFVALDYQGKPMCHQCFARIKHLTLRAR